MGIAYVMELKKRWVTIFPLLSMAFGTPLWAPGTAGAQEPKTVECTVHGDADKGMCTPEPGYLVVRAGETLRVTLHHDLASNVDVNFEAYHHANSEFLGESVDIDHQTGPPNVTVWRSRAGNGPMKVYVMADPDPHWNAVGIKATYTVN